jgi:hypothetical protein
MGCRRQESNLRLEEVSSRLRQPSADPAYGVLNSPPPNSRKGPEQRTNTVRHGEVVLDLVTRVGRAN